MINYTPESGHSIFNAGIAKLMRIDKLKLVVHESRITKNYYAWYQGLLGIWEEVSEMLSEAEQAECKQMAMDCRRTNPTPNRKQQDPYMYAEDAMLLFGMHLSSLEHKYGMGMPKQKAVSFLDT